MARGLMKFFGSFIWGELFLGDFFFCFLRLGWGGFLLDRMKMMIQLRKLMQGKTMCFFESGIFVFLEA